MTSRPLNRVTPLLSVDKMQTHHILAPADTHFRKATCEEVECPHYLKGWGLPLKGLDEGDIWQAKNSGRKWTELEIKAGEKHLWFEAGQPCFRASTHRIRIEREEVFLLRPGDWRGQPSDRKPIVFSGADAWADSVQTNLDQIERRR